MPQIPGRFGPAPRPQQPPQPVPQFVDPTAEPLTDIFGFAEVTNFVQATARPQRRAALSAGAGGATFISEGGGPGQNPLLPRSSLVGWDMRPENVARAMGLEKF